MTQDGSIIISGQALFQAEGGRTGSSDVCKILWGAVNKNIVIF